MPWPIAEGWGLTHVPGSTTSLISDGSNEIFEVRLSDPPEIVRSFKIFDPRKKPLGRLNELEWIKGLLWANIYPTNDIAVIDLSTRVAKIVDFSLLRTIANKVQRHLKKKPLDDQEVLNGIAYNEEKGTVFLTGKHWPLMFEIKMDLSFGMI